MGATVALMTCYGVETPRSVFWEPVGKQIVCSRDLNHTICEGGKFCPICGREVRDLTIEAPTPQFVSVCQRFGVEPVKFFELLNKDADGSGWEWTDDGDGGSGQVFKLCWMAGAAFIGGYVPDAATQIHVLGFKLDEVERWNWKPENPRVSAITLTEMATYDRGAREIAKLFGIEAEPKLYSQVYYS